MILIFIVKGDRVMAVPEIQKRLQQHGDFQIPISNRGVAGGERCATIFIKKKNNKFQCWNVLR